MLVWSARTRHGSVVGVVESPLVDELLLRILSTAENWPGGPRPTVVSKSVWTGLVENVLVRVTIDHGHNFELKPRESSLLDMVVHQDPYARSVTLPSEKLTESQQLDP